MEDVKKLYEVCVRKTQATEIEYQSLIKKLDTLEEETKPMRLKIQDCENEEKAVYDNYFLGKASDKDLSAVQDRVKKTKDALSLHSKKLESLNRCIVQKQKEIQQFQKQEVGLRHQLWEAIFKQKASGIPEDVKTIVKELVAIGLQASMHRDFILSKIFTLPNNLEIQKIYKQLSKEFGIE
jgi:predicted  nucleic acid-binding Zn-ribbon protein